MFILFRVTRKKNLWLIKPREGKIVTFYGVRLWRYYIRVKNWAYKDFRGWIFKWVCTTVFSPQAENLENISTYEYHQYFDFIGKAKLIVVGTSNFYIRFEKNVSEPLTHQSLDLNLKLLWIWQIIWRPKSWAAERNFEWGGKILENCEGKKKGLSTNLPGNCKFCPKIGGGQNHIVVPHLWNWGGGAQSAPLFRHLWPKLWPSLLMWWKSLTFFESYRAISNYI